MHPRGRCAADFQPGTTGRWWTLMKRWDPVEVFQAWGLPWRRALVSFSLFMSGRWREWFCYTKHTCLNELHLSPYDKTVTIMDLPNHGMKLPKLWAKDTFPFCKLISTLYFVIAVQMANIAHSLKKGQQILINILGTPCRGNRELVFNECGFGFAR